MNVPGLPPAWMVPAVHNTVPLLVNVEFGQSWLLPVVMFNVPPEASVKMPLQEPTDQPMVPLNTALVLPMSVPLSTVKKALGFTVSGPFNTSV